MLGQTRRRRMDHSLPSIEGRCLLCRCTRIRPHLRRAGALDTTRGISLYLAPFCSVLLDYTSDRSTLHHYFLSGQKKPSLTILLTSHSTLSQPPILLLRYLALYIVALVNDFFLHIIMIIKPCMALPTTYRFTWYCDIRLRPASAKALVRPRPASASPSSTHLGRSLPIRASDANTGRRPVCLR